MATIKYKDADGNLVTVGAGLHTHSPSSIGAAEAEHEHDVATADNDGFLSSTDKTKIDALNDTVFGNADKNIKSLVGLVGDDPVSEQISSAVANKVDKVTGKGLSTNDYTTAEKNKLADIAENANNYKHPSYTTRTEGLYKIVVNSWGHVNSATPVQKSDITALGIPATNTTYVDATTGASGLMSAADKTKLNNIAEGATKVKVDDTLSSTSTNPVQNKVVYAIDNKVGDSPVQEQISSAIGTATTDITTAANKYTDTKIAALINGAPTTLDTLKEIADAMAENDNVVGALDEAIGAKADSEHTHELGDVTKLQENLNAKVPNTRTVNGKALSSDISLTASDVGAADADHAHDGRYYTENEVDAKLDDLVGDKPVSEQISAHAAVIASTSVAGHMSATDKTNLNAVIAQLGGYTIKYAATSASLPNDNKIITLVPRGQ